MGRVHPIVNQFVGALQRHGSSVQQSAMIRDNLYLIDGGRQLLIRSSKYFPERDCYFFGLTKPSFEQFAMVPDGFVAFICGDLDHVYVVPSRVVASWLPALSADRKQYKLIVRDERAIFAASSGRRPFDLRPFLGLDSIHANLRQAPGTEPATQTRKHAEVQGMLLEIGNLRGFRTYSPDRASSWARGTLGKTATLREAPVIPGIASDVARRVDVLWFDDEIPVDAFEVELTTGIWSGLVRLGEFVRLSTRLHVITDDAPVHFERKISSFVFKPLVQRCSHASVADVKKLHAAEQHVSDLRATLRV
jgi:hypothetical protein